MTSTFDPQDKTSWYFGPMSREEANKMFENVTTQGAFLVRESKTHKDDFVLCVREGSIIKHYIVNKVTHDNGYFFKIGEMKFPDIPALLAFYQTHYLEKSPVTQPVPREKVITKYDFPGQDEEDLPFKSGDILEIISKDEDRWWTARNMAGRIGQIPVPYVNKYNEHPDNKPNNNTEMYDTHQMSTLQSSQKHEHVQLPAKGLVIRNRIPNVFDKTQLRLTEGETITVLQINEDGKWLGRVGDRQGFFPFTHIELINDES